MSCGPDGTLCRITSSTKNLFNNIRIVRVPDEERTESGSHYTLLIEGTDDEDDSTSEESDEISEDEEIFNVQLPVESLEKEKDIESKIDKVAETNKSKTQEQKKKHFNKKKYHSNYKQNNSFRNSKTSNKTAQSYTKSNSNSSYRIFNTSGTDNHGTYCSPSQNTAAEIPPWSQPPPVLFTNPQYPMHTVYPNTINAGMQYSVEMNSEIPRKSGSGLLGDAPGCNNYPPNFQTDLYGHNNQNQFSHAQSNFAINNNDAYIHNQTPFPPVPQNYNQTDAYAHERSNNFNNDQSYQGYSYSKYHSNNYQRLGPKRGLIPGPSHHEKFYQNNRSWNGQNRRRRGNRKRNQRDK